MTKLIKILFVILFLCNCSFQNKPNEIVVKNKYRITIPSKYGVEICEDCPEDFYAIFLMKGKNRVCTLYCGANPNFPTKMVPDSIKASNCEINNLQCKFYTWSSEKELFSKELLIKLNDDPIHDWAIFINIIYHDISLKESQKIELTIQSVNKINDKTLPVEQLTKNDSLVIDRHIKRYGF